ncbi:SPOSA6832_01381 [Sporobolomyces salmonicolor]|uniref:SPOSA6832_01381-mRNA-1:cds n=1 Tax=Sporidiobolus salmonicolor TaxID=5005 RepID=A0A0D6EIF4_SPOSA|nr:SPOSA6832_01381 [Sporobolomyces salmonicolor]
MPAKRAKLIVHRSPARAAIDRSRKRRKTHAGPSLRIARDSRTDEVDDSDAFETGSESEDELAGDYSDRRRRSLPRQQHHPGRSSRATSTSSGGVHRAATRGRPSRSGQEDALVTQPPPPPAPAAARATRRGGHQPLSPLPVNHSVPRTRVASKGKGKEVDMPVPAKRSRDAGLAHRVTRRTSGSILAEEARGLKRKRRSGRMIVDESEEEDEVVEEELEEEEEAEMEQEEDSGVRRRLRSGDSKLQDAAEEVDSEVGEEADSEMNEQDLGDQDMADDDVEAKLRDWTASQLRRLLHGELVELYLVAASPSDFAPDAATQTKDTLIASIIGARNARSTAPDADAGSSADESDGGSPRPRTSLEASPEDERPSPARKGRTGGRTIRKKVVRRTGGGGKHPLTPPHTSGEEDNEDEVDIEPEEELEAAPAPEPEPAAGSMRMTRRASQVEMPPPPIPARRHLRTRSNASIAFPVAESSTAAAARELRNGKKVASRSKAQIHVQFDAVEEDEVPPFTSPVAHRTRRAAPTVSVLAARSPGRQARVAAPGSPRPGRAAKQKAVARLAKGDKGKGKVSADEVDDADMALDGEEEEAEIFVLSSDSEAEGDEEPFPGDETDSSSRVRRRRPSGRAAAKDVTPAKAAGRRRRFMRTAKQVETPPSDADEESAGEYGEQDEAGENSEAEESTELMSHLRLGKRQLRNGKVVRLRKGEGKVQDEDAVEEEPELGEEDGEDEDMDAEYEEEDEDEQLDEDEVDLANATSKTLLRRKKDELVRLCEERDLSNDGRATKQQLVDALLQWRDQETGASSPDSASSASSTLSNVSTETARAETKTQRLDTIEHASARTSKNTPLLMRAEHPASPEKPRTPNHSKEREQQEDVNALDLESLQLQDKEIPPDKLTKLELVGSGGFKDVYKGMYRKRTIAICDIRGHLTDMDIKELGLLRDLRHDNIVQFIGVSIPKQPSSVPVMIVTELCANGDLFDYIRGVEAPRFRDILEIMLGIAKGIEYLHARKPTIIHRDIKSSNVLITAQGVAKIADFGLARIKTSTKSMIRSLVGTVNWQAPELWHPHPRYNEKVDVYSVGLVFWEMLQWHQAVKRYPFEGMNEHAIYGDVGQRQLRPSTAGLHRRWGGDIVDLMSKMWEQDPTKRPTMPEVVAGLKQLLADEKAKQREARRSS